MCSYGVQVTVAPFRYYAMCCIRCVAFWVRLVSNFGFYDLALVSNNFRVCGAATTSSLVPSQPNITMASKPIAIPGAWERQAKKARKETKQRKEKQKKKPAKPLPRPDLSGTSNSPSTNSANDDRFFSAVENLSQLTLSDDSSEYTYWIMEVRAPLFAQLLLRLIANFSLTSSYLRAAMNTSAKSTKST
jgi:hypothetical protein